HRGGAEGDRVPRAAAGVGNKTRCEQGPWVSAVVGVQAGEQRPRRVVGVDVDPDRRDGGRALAAERERLRQAGGIEGDRPLDGLIPEQHGAGGGRGSPPGRGVRPRRLADGPLVLVSASLVPLMLVDDTRVVTRVWVC